MEKEDNKSVDHVDSQKINWSDVARHAVNKRWKNTSPEKRREFMDYVRSHQNLTPEERKERASKAAKARWAKARAEKKTNVAKHNEAV